MSGHLTRFAIALVLLTGVDPAGAQLRATLFDELTPLFLDSDPTDGVPSLTIDTPRGVPAGAHILVTGVEADAEISFAAESDLGRPVWYQLIDVPVEENTGIESRTERYDGQTNPYVIRRAPFRIYEVLRPVDRPLICDAPAAALRVEFPVSDTATTGEHRIAIRISAAAERADLELVLHVFSAVIPPIGAESFRYTNWFSPTNISKWHGLEPWSEAHWQMLGRYAALMARGRQNTFWVRYGDIFLLDESGRPRLNRDRLERYVTTFESAGLYYIEGAPLAHRPNGDWSRADLELGVVGVPATGEAGAAALAAMTGQIMAVIGENGWEGRWIQHLSDEPTDTNAED